MNPIVDFHTHWAPVRYREAIERDGEWLGLDGSAGELHSAGMRLTLEERIADMDAVGVEMQVLSPPGGFFQYDNELRRTVAIARECNAELAEIAAAHPGRFAGFGTLPMQDVGAAVEELERAVSDGLSGAMINDHVNGTTYDDPRFVPLWRAAEASGAVLFFHQSRDQRCRVERFFLDNTVGNLVERTLTFGTIAAAGILDRFPSLKLLLAHGGGYAVWAAPRMDKAAGAFAPDGSPRYVPPYETTPAWPAPALRAPSDYLGSFFYDCCTFSGSLLRAMIDAAGPDRIVLGTDTPARMILSDSVRWLSDLDVLSKDEKEGILRANATTLLNI